MSRDVMRQFIFAADMGRHGLYRGPQSRLYAIGDDHIPLLTGTHEIEIWGDGEQTRSFTCIDDSCTAPRRSWQVMCVNRSTSGNDELVTINQVVDFVEAVASM